MTGTESMSVWNFISLLAGLSIFLYGMKYMGDSLERAAGTRMKALMGTVTNNRFLAMLAGMLITVAVQSSTATTVMVVGFVNASILSLTQAIGVIMGANIGTTVTSLLLSVKIPFGAIFACLGLILSHLPKKVKGAQSIGSIVMGLGLMFVGMDTMSTAMKPLQNWDVFKNAIVSIDNPVLCVLIGAVITAVLHSSAASVGMLQALVGEGLVPLHTAMFILFGQNIGTCITALVSSSGTGTNAKRAAIVHLLFNVAGTILFVVLGIIFPISDWIMHLVPDNLRLQIALVHIFFNVGTTLVMLPATKLLEKLACLIVPEGDGTAAAMRLKYFDDRLLATPPIAAAQLFRETQRMGDLALENLSGAMACFDQFDEDKAAEVMQREDVLDYLNHEITRKLTEVKGLALNAHDTRLVGSLFHVVTDMERVGDHAVNILDSARSKEKDGIRFTAKVTGELDALYQTVREQLERSVEIFHNQNITDEQLQQVADVEAQIDAETERLRAHHIDRVKNRKCSARNGMLYIDMLTNLERVGDHAENIATSVTDRKKEKQTA